MTLRQNGSRLMGKSTNFDGLAVLRHPIMDLPLSLPCSSFDTQRIMYTVNLDLPCCEEILQLKHSACPIALILNPNNQYKKILQLIHKAPFELLSKRRFCSIFDRPYHSDFFHSFSQNESVILKMDSFVL